MPFTFNAERLLALAAERGDTTRTAIAKRVGIDIGSVSRYLAGTRQPSLARTSLMARAYGVELSELTSSVRAA
jgi:transcriptional regulator with XRE-family HTH domain